MTAVDTPTLSSTEVCDLVGCTYRQLDYWARVDLIAATAKQAAGSGTKRRFTARDLAMVHVVHQVMTLAPQNPHVRRFMNVAREAPPRSMGHPNSRRELPGGRRRSSHGFAVRPARGDLCEGAMTFDLSVETLGWYDQAACADTNPDLFYDLGGRRSGLDAKAVCAHCPVVDLCLEAAIAVDPADDYGVWGGSTPPERVRMRRARTALHVRLLRRHGHPSIGHAA